ncbi:MAG TPA: nuclear transport factor 2 family protein [Steroidobacteraceae bacterium]|nr:nuclear transport factor 2 family protein [Steroidobacteraceae bacterium]
MKKRTIAATFVAALALTLVVAGAACADAPGAAEAIKKIENSWSDAQKRGDAAFIGQILADDWQGLGPDGKTETKQSVLERIKSGDSKVTAIENGPMDVKFLANGTVAVVHGSDMEKSSSKGKDTSGKWVWTDVFEKRQGKWLAVRSQATPVH